MSLYQKLRPTNFKAIIGNSAIVKYLENEIGNYNRPHVYLFHGSTGCGKTTMARIFAKELGCSGLDYTEVDVGDYRGIDTIRDLRATMHNAPMESECRVWVMDEVHRLTKDAQEALLKALEDTPKHVYFLLATTDKQKLLPTLLNRCVPCPVNPLNHDEMKKLLLRSSKAMQFKADDEKLESIIDAANDIPRAALVLFEKHMMNPDATIDYMSENSKEIIDLCRLLLKKASWKEISKVLKDLKGQDAESIRRAVLGYATSVILNGLNSQALLILDVFKDHVYDSGFPGIVWACAVCVQKE